MAKENNTTNPFRSATPNPVTFSNQIQDENYGKRQSVINHEAMRQQGCLVVDRMTGIPALPCWMRRGQTIFIKSDAYVYTAYAAVRVMDRDGGDETTWRKVYGGNISEVKATNSGENTDSVSFTYTFPEPTSKNIVMYIQMNTDYRFYDGSGQLTASVTPGQFNSIGRQFVVPLGTSKIKIEATTYSLKTVLVAFRDGTFMDPIRAPKAFRFTGRYEIDNLGLYAPVWEHIPVRTRFVRGKGQVAMFDLFNRRSTNKVLPISVETALDSGVILASDLQKSEADIIRCIIPNYNSNDIRIFIRLRRGNSIYVRGHTTEDRTPMRFTYGREPGISYSLQKIREYVIDPGSNNANCKYAMSIIGGGFVFRFLDIALVRTGRNCKGKMSPYVRSSDRLYYRLTYHKVGDVWRFVRI